MEGEQHMADEDQVQELIDHLTNTPGATDAFRESPADAVEQHGIELTDEQRDKLESEDWSGVSDDDIVDRLSARGTAAWL
jgi:hypothetical protein